MPSCSYEPPALMYGPQGGLQLILPVILSRTSYVADAKQILLAYQFNNSLSSQTRVKRARRGNTTQMARFQNCSVFFYKKTKRSFGKWRIKNHISTSPWKVTWTATPGSRQREHWHSIFPSHSQAAERTVQIVSKIKLGRLCIKISMKTKIFVLIQGCPDRDE